MNMPVHTVKAQIILLGMLLMCLFHDAKGKDCPSGWHVRPDMIQRLLEVKFHQPVPTATYQFYDFDMLLRHRRDNVLKYVYNIVYVVQSCQVDASGAWDILMYVGESTGSFKDRYSSYISATTGLQEVINPNRKGTKHLTVYAIPERVNVCRLDEALLLKVGKKLNIAVGKNSKRRIRDKYGNIVVRDQPINLKVTNIRANPFQNRIFRGDPDENFDGKVDQTEVDRRRELKNNALASIGGERVYLDPPPEPRRNPPRTARSSYQWRMVMEPGKAHISGKQDLVRLAEEQRKLERIARVAPTGRGKGKSVKGRK